MTTAVLHLHSTPTPFISTPQICTRVHAYTRCYTDRNTHILPCLYRESAYTLRVRIRMYVHTCTHCAYIYTMYLHLHAVHTSTHCAYMYTLCIHLHAVHTCTQCAYIYTLCIHVEYTVRIRVHHAYVCTHRCIHAYTYSPRPQHIRELLTQVSLSLSSASPRACTRALRRCGRLCDLRPSLPGEG